MSKLTTDLHQRLSDQLDIPREVIRTEFSVDVKEFIRRVCFNEISQERILEAMHSAPDRFPQDDWIVLLVVRNRHASINIIPHVAFSRVPDDDMKICSWPDCAEALRAREFEMHTLEIYIDSSNNNYYLARHPHNIRRLEYDLCIYIGKTHTALECLEVIAGCLDFPTYSMFEKDCLEFGKAFAVELVSLDHELTREEWQVLRNVTVIQWALLRPSERSARDDPHSAQAGRVSIFGTLGGGMLGSFLRGVAFAIGVLLVIAAAKAIKADIVDL